MTSEELTIDLTIPLKEKAFRQGKEEGIEQGIERGIEQGIERGIEKGMRQGLEKGVFSTLVRLLERRFGSLSPDLLGLLERAHLPALNRLVDLALEAESLHQVEAEVLKMKDEG